MEGDEIVIEEQYVDTPEDWKDNIPTVNVIPVAEINTYELADNKFLVLTIEALKRIEEVLA